MPSTVSGKGGLRRDLEALFGEGPSPSMDDGQLLDRFLGCRDEDRERAFELLVARHGPMVHRVCLRILGDSHEAHDAFQAAFLVLARRAGSVRDRESVGGWLYGVSLRVAARARTGMIRRRNRERLVGEGLDAVEAPAGVSTAPGSVDAEAVHREIGRLSEKYRTPIVLCYLEGLTHDEAAARLNWPVGTVRSRLARARDQLRVRLSRRGLAAPAAVGGVPAWLASGKDATANLALEAPPPLPPELFTSTVYSASAFARGKVAASCSATSQALTKGVLTSMALEKLMIATWAFVPAGIVALAAGTIHGQGSVAEATRAPASAPVATKAAEAKVLLDPLEQRLLEAARARLSAQKAYYEEGRITIDRYIMASQHVMEVERSVSRTDVDRLAAIQRHVDRLREIEQREKAELNQGKGTIADVAEIQEQLLEAEVLLKKSRMRASPDPKIVALERRLSEIERKLDEILKRQDERPR